MSGRTPRTPSRLAPSQPEPEDSYPQIPEPKQGHGGLVLAFLSVLAVLGFGVWTAIGTLASDSTKPAANPAATSAPTRAAATAPTPAPTAVATSAVSPSPTAAPGSRVHTVAQGDTLFGIAQRYKTTVDAIMAANNITDRSKVLHVGDKLVIP